MATATIDPTIIEGPMPNSPDWYAERHNHIGASEAAAACGVSPYSQPLDIYMRKRGLLEEVKENQAMRLGKALEPVIRDEWSRLTDRETAWNLPMMWRADTPHISATLDCRVIPDMEPLELKSTSFRRAAEFGEEFTDEIPTDYVLQCQQQIYVVGAELCHLAVLIDGRTLRRYTVRRNEKLICRIVELETELWERIQSGDPPPPDFKHPKTLELMKSLYGVEEGKEVDLSIDAVQSWVRYRELGERISELEKERKAEQSKVLYAMGDGAIADLGDGLDLVRKSVSRKGYTVEPCEYILLSQRKRK